MKYMLLIQAGSAEANEAECDYSAWQDFDKEIQGSGVVVSSERLADLVTTTTVRVGENGKKAVTDGPFAETREVLGGFYVVDVPDLDTALDWAAKCPGSRGSGAVEVRPVAES
ncbi:YciI family protein [Salininema proteolyticum]|uniref:YciI family protein n=1 Tax=Salininema proteolyticum TaxID=1607685 RepID=A0ABV8U3N9_9ACTN